MEEKIKLLDVVVLTKPMPELELCKGELGRIITIFPRSGKKYRYDQLWNEIPIKTTPWFNTWCRVKKLSHRI
ncbi:DUF4926 domain-containing protein, partial [Persicitalea sp.]|uniref:DUF4926 domain-containing protein n=1 Tax=Persicitalea sp. TaxID=3100273 RepID=UPI003594630C